MSMNLSLFKISSISKFPSLIPTPDHLSFEAAAKVQFLISLLQTKKLIFEARTQGGT
jgi:hypothetical protein